MGDKAIKLVLTILPHAGERLFACVWKPTKIIHVYKVERKSSEGNHEF